MSFPRWLFMQLDFFLISWLFLWYGKSFGEPKSVHIHLQNSLAHTQPVRRRLLLYKEEPMKCVAKFLQA